MASAAPRIELLALHCKLGVDSKARKSFRPAHERQPCFRASGMCMSMRHVHERQASQMSASHVHELQACSWAPGMFSITSLRNSVGRVHEPADISPGWQVFPEQLDVRANSSATFRVAFRPPLDGQYYSQTLEVVACLKSQRSFRGVADAAVLPPWTMPVQVCSTHCILTRLPSTDSCSEGNLLAKITRFL